MGRGGWWKAGCWLLEGRNGLIELDEIPDIRYGHLGWFMLCSKFAMAVESSVLVESISMGSAILKVVFAALRHSARCPSVTA